MRRRTAPGDTLVADQYVIGFLRESVMKERMKAFKKEFAEHKICIESTLAVSLTVLVSQMLLLITPAAGAVATVAALVFLCVFALISKRARLMAVTGSLLPAASMASMALPQTAALAVAGVLYGTLGFLALAYSWILRSKRTGRKGALKTFLSGLPWAVTIGAGIGLLGYVLLGNETSFTIKPGYMFGAAAASAVVEEVYFRGLLQRVTRKSVGPLFSVFLSAATYTAMTIPVGNIRVSAVATVASIALGWLFYAKQQLVLNVVANVLSKALFLAAILYLS